MNEMNATFPALLVVSGLLGCLALHWLIGKLGQQVGRRLEARNTNPNSWLRSLSVEWAVKGVRTFL